jgi:hypothetical protein
MIAGDIATKAASVEIGFLDRFSGLWLLWFSRCGGRGARSGDRRLGAFVGIFSMPNNAHLTVDRTQAFMLAGPIGAGKTTLFNLLFGRQENSRKTQAVEYEADIGVDTPGEFSATPVSIMPDHRHPMSGFWFMCRGRRFFLSDAARIARCLWAETGDRGDHQNRSAAGGCDRVESLMRENGIGGPIFRVTSCVPDSASLKHILTGATGSWGPGFVPGEEALP